MYGKDIRFQKEIEFCVEKVCTAALVVVRAVQKTYFQYSCINGVTLLGPTNCWECTNVCLVSPFPQWFSVCKSTTTTWRWVSAILWAGTAPRSKRRSHSWSGILLSRTPRATDPVSPKTPSFLLCYLIVFLSCRRRRRGRLLAALTQNVLCPVCTLRASPEHVPAQRDVSGRLPVKAGGHFFGSKTTLWQSLRPPQKPQRRTPHRRRT